MSEATTPVQAFCTHGGDDSRRWPGGTGPNGRTGACEACVTKLLKERDQLREVLRDAAEEQGFQKVAKSIEADLRTVRQHIKSAAFTEMYSVHGGRRTHPLVQARETLDSVLQLLSWTVRAQPAPVLVDVVLPADACRVCSAAAGSACNPGRHGSAWCFHAVCGRLMRGAVCDHCGYEPVLEQAELVTNPHQLQEPGTVCGICGAIGYHWPGYGCAG